MIEDTASTRTPANRHWTSPTCILFVRPTVVLAIFDNGSKTGFAIVSADLRARESGATGSCHCGGLMTRIAARRPRKLKIWTQPVDKTARKPKTASLVAAADTAFLLTPARLPGRYRDMVTEGQGLHRRRAISFRSCWRSVLPTLSTCRRFDLYRALRRINPSPFLYFLDLPEAFALVGSSPEILVRVRDDEVTIRPIAGTRKRGKQRESTR